MAETVECREIEGHPGYRVGSDGSVWSQRRGTWRKLAAAPDDQGRPRVRLRDRSNRIVAQLVLSAFRPEGYFEGAIVRHLDGDNGNNAVDNLAFGTQADNYEDARRHGTNPNGERHGGSKLTADDVHEIRRLGGVMPQRVIAAHFGVHQTCISKVLTRRHWAGVE